MCVHDLHDHAPVFYTTDVHARTHVCVCVGGGTIKICVLRQCVCVCQFQNTVLFKLSNTALCCSLLRTLPRCAGRQKRAVY